MDQSALDKKYFIDGHVYNCPFCKRNNVPYTIVYHHIFDWSDQKDCHLYIVECYSCKKKSLHLSYSYLIDDKVYSKDKFVGKEDLDTEFFYHQPTSKFVLDSRINAKIRDLLTEGENCRSANSLVGASACLRKAIYEFLSIEDCLVINEGEKYASYNDSIEKAKIKFSNVSPVLFGALKKIKALTSDLIHEDSWKSWSSSEIDQITKLFKYILYEVYVREDEQSKMLEEVDTIEKKLSESSTSKKTI